MKLPGDLNLTAYRGASLDLVITFMKNEAPHNLTGTAQMKLYKLNSIVPYETVNLTITDNILSHSFTVAKVLEFARNGRHEIIFSEGANVTAKLRGSLEVENVQTSGSVVSGATVTLTETNLIAQVTEGIPGPKGKQGKQGIQGEQGETGDDGWTPVFATVSDGARRVSQVADWTGGEGTKPDTGRYVGVAGLVADIADGVDIRGEGLGTHETTIANHDDVDLTGISDGDLLTGESGVIVPKSREDISVDMIFLDTDDLQFYGKPLSPVTGQEPSTIQGFENSYNINIGITNGIEAYQSIVLNRKNGYELNIRSGLILGADSNNYYRIEFHRNEIIVIETIAGTPSTVASQNVLINNTRWRMVNNIQTKLFFNYSFDRRCIITCDSISGAVDFELNNDIVDNISFLSFFSDSPDTNRTGEIKKVLISGNLYEL